MRGCEGNKTQFLPPKSYQSKRTELTQLKQLCGQESLVPKTYRRNSLMLKSLRMLDFSLRKKKKFFFFKSHGHVMLRLSGHISILPSTARKLRAKYAGHI